jgi:hypothetical protein
MINTPTWRPLIYDLSNDHKDSLLVGFSIQQISAAGHQDELLSLSAAANDFAVYNRILEHALSKIFRMDSGDMFSFVPELKKMSARHEHTYLYTQALVHMLEMEPNGKSLRRLAEELEAQASSRDPVARKIPFQLTTIGEHPQVLTSLIMMLNAGQSNPADIGRVRCQLSGFYVCRPLLTVSFGSFTTCTPANHLPLLASYDERTLLTCWYLKYFARTLRLRRWRIEPNDSRACI